MIPVRVDPNVKAHVVRSGLRAPTRRRATHEQEATDGR